MNMTEPIRQHHDAFAIAGLTSRTTNRVAVSKGGTVQVLAGDYLVFTGQGQLPQAVLDVWQRIWAYFEAYTSPTDVTVWIGIE